MASAAPAEGRLFRPLFERWSRRVRVQLALGHVLTGTALGLLVGVGASAALWQTRHGVLRPVGAAAGLFGVAAGAAGARRKRWSDTDIALYLDARLHADEAITTAVERDAAAESARAVVLAQATAALAHATPEAVRAPLLRPWHTVLPLAALALGGICLAPLPPPPTGPAAAPGSGKVQIAELAGLEKVIALGGVSARDEAQRERLKKLVEGARKLREKLKDGMEKREAQAEISKLEDGVIAERLSLGDGEQRQGMESALGKLGENADLKRAQKALGDRDLVTLDDEMERLANRMERSDRERAQRTLEEAARAARQSGAPAVAKALDAERKRLAEQGKRMDRLHELAKELGDALGEEGREALQGKEGQRLAEKLNEALGKLTPEQRRQLAENLKKKIQAAPEQELGPGPSKRELAELLDELSTREAQKRLEDELRELSEAPPAGSEEGDRQKKLDDAEEGADEAEKQLGGGMPMPLPVAGSGKGQGGPVTQGETPKPSGPTGHTEGGEAPGNPRGATGVIEGGAMQARAAARIDSGRTMPGVVMGRSAGRAGETANVRGMGALGSAAPGELGGVERSDVPEEYREQVGRYFQPK